MHIQCIFIDDSARFSIKEDTSAGFAPNYRPAAQDNDLVDAITRLDERIAAFSVHTEWLTALRREAYIANAQASASIEGNPLTIEESQDVLRRHETRSLRRPRPDEREILQHYQYFQHLQRLNLREPPDLTVAEIESTHRNLLTRVVDSAKRPGELRGPQNQAYVSVGRLECTPPSRVAAELGALHSWYYSDALALPHAVRIAIWFSEFESIHPFRDGNGRVGRALTHRLLYSDGLSNSIFVALDRPFSQDRQGYYRALASVHQTGRLDSWVRHFLEALKDAYETSLKVLVGLGGIPTGLTGAPRAVMEYLLRSGRSDISVAELVFHLGRYKPITITVALQRLAKDFGFVVHNGVAGRGSRYQIGPAIQRLLSPPIDAARL